MVVFKCQEDSFLKQYTSKVLHCNKVEDERGSYQVILEDTIIFPEGGGQPCDHGSLNDIPVTQVIRVEDKAVHFVEKPLEVGQTVEQKIDWKRRFDHMQQHSGQHLLSAILEREFNYPTVSWWLGQEDSYVELGTTSVSSEEIQKAEEIVNDLIRQGREVTVTVYSEDSASEALKQAHSRRLPADHTGDIRMITIDGIDDNMCCGTHVTNLRQLQMIKLLHVEKSKRKENLLLHFLVGGRVLERLAVCLERERGLTKLLNNNASEHIDLVDKLQKNVKMLTKNLQTVLKDLAVAEAQKLKDSAAKYYFLHRKEAQPDFMNHFIKELNRSDIFLFLSTGDEKTTGNILLYGDENVVQVLGSKACELLDGKGAGTGNRFQAKVSKMANRKKVESLIVEYFNMGC